MVMHCGPDFASRGDSGVYRPQPVVDDVDGSSTAVVCPSLQSISGGLAVYGQTAEMRVRGRMRSGQRVSSPD